MTVKYVCSAVTAVVLTCGVGTVARADPQRDASVLPPNQSGVVTVTGCLQAYGKHGDEFVLARTIAGVVAGVPEATCSATVDANSLELEDPSEAGIDQSLLGHWIEVTGRLEKEMSKNPENLRELDVMSFRMVPVIPPQRSEAAPAPFAPAPIEQPAAAPAEEIPVATTGEIPPTLPKTGSPLPALQLLGLLSLAGGLALRYRRLEERG